MGRVPVVSFFFFSMRGDDSAFLLHIRFRLQAHSSAAASKACRPGGGGAFGHQSSNPLSLHVASVNPNLDHMRKHICLRFDACVAGPHAPAAGAAMINLKSRHALAWRCVAADAGRVLFIIVSPNLSGGGYPVLVFPSPSYVVTGDSCKKRAVDRNRLANTSMFGHLKEKWMASRPWHSIASIFC